MVHCLGRDRPEVIVKRFASRKGRWSVMERFPKSRVEIERLVLHELQITENCRGARGISVVDWADPRCDANWTVGAYNSGTSPAYDCERALQIIVPRLQGFYELVQKH
jgi:hypothetical protein